MKRYALLILPSTNRVYASASVAMTQSELELFNRSVLDDRIAEVSVSTIGGLNYVTFLADKLDNVDAAYLANLSSSYALFEVVGDLLRPVELRPLDRYDDDLITIQKYPGKTNEQFTKLMLNVCILSSVFAREMLSRKFTVLDPLCGRGTTLSQALMYGFDAAGVDIDRKDFEAYSAFMQTWLKRKRIKHHAEHIPVRRNKQIVARRLQISLAAEKEDYKAGEAQHLDVVNADTTRATEFFRAGSVDLVVTDGPYGVQHGSRTAAAGLVRSPLDLLSAAVPGWVALMRGGGALAISWNTLVARREDAAAVLTGAGLDVLDSDPYLAFRHRVDQAITRDVLVARKPDEKGFDDVIHSPPS